MNPGRKISYSEVIAFHNIIREMDAVERIILHAVRKSKDGRIDLSDFLNEAAGSMRYGMFTPMEVSTVSFVVEQEIFRKRRKWANAKAFTWSNGRTRGVPERSPGGHGRRKSRTIGVEERPWRRKRVHAGRPVGVTGSLQDQNGID